MDSDRGQVYSESPRDSARASPEPHNGFQKTVTAINRTLGTSSGIDSETVEVEELKRIMANYVSQEQDWQMYAFADASRAYTRNLVHRGNGRCNLLVLVWSPGKSSPIHDHANSHCVMKILKGSLTETLYCWPCERGNSPEQCAAIMTTEHTCAPRNISEEAGGSLEVRRVTEYGQDEVTYMSDALGLHRIRNSSSTDFAVSLHLYTPPNASRNGCHIFDETTGAKVHVSQCHFHSEFGVKF